MRQLEHSRSSTRWVVASSALLACVSLMAATPASATKPTAPPPKAGKAPPAAAKEEPVVQELAPLASREVIEKLKSLRSEIVLEEEQVRLLKTRLERLDLETEVIAAESRRLAAASPQATPAAGRPAARGPSRPAAPKEPDLVVKAVTLRPFKEAIVMYRGRVYTVRPGDKLGSMVVRDVTQGGLITENEEGRTRQEGVSY